MNQQTSDNIKQSLQYALENGGKIGDNIVLNMDSATNDFYTSVDYKNVWSDKEKWNPLADSVYTYIQNAELSGLFPNDYHFDVFKSIKTKLDTDSTHRMDAALWTKADLLLTDGFVHIINDLKFGRIPADSISINKKDSSFNNDFYTNALKKLLEEKQLTTLLSTYEPSQKGYWELKNGIKNFLDSMDRRTYTHLKYPYKKNEKDSLAFIDSLETRLTESKCLTIGDLAPDSTQLKSAIKKYQGLKGIKPDGIISTSLVKLLNTNDIERFKRIAITLDRYKQLPSQMPERYIWVNLPGYYLKVWDNDTVALESKVICGKPLTRSPLLTSSITNMITYPTWTVPNSIIVKQYLPKLKTNPHYLQKIGLNILDKDGNIVDPTKVNWQKYSKGIPYKIMQGSGDDNALGVLKFNFNNKFAVYLHDTNERGLFKRSVRSLSHGCVRVQEWEQLAFYILKYDSTNAKPNEKIAYNTDSLLNILARKEKKTIFIKHRLPLFIRYMGCEGKDGKIIFYDDMYGEDETIRNKYFANK
ncbi:L,D-transpeptidase family protein [Ferruginibacter albus]|uniref:L,D-transpeptidase family protein n=1 Tax=Ferruginibacter albus TaxID=2875540 RepID=UPI001CC44253|nr:L,D-transpeptidase family protein [Ferruginibacter albus]UAY53512.1 L,D-transpeptidase family protein [Ferruginibacter albus]